MDSGMTHSSEAALSDRIMAWIQTDGGDQALLFITLDAAMRPHVILLARDEVAVVSPSRLRVALAEASRTSGNLLVRPMATLAIYDADLACVIKLRALPAPRTVLPTTVAWDLAVEDVRFDAPAAAESAARLVTGLRFEGRPDRADLRAALR